MRLSALGLAQFTPGFGRLVVPDVCCDLVWARGRLTLTGPLTRATTSTNAGHDVTLLKLHPLVAYEWLRVPLSCFTDRAIELRDVNPSLAYQVDHLKCEGRLIELVQPIDASISASADSRVVVAIRDLARGTSVATVAATVGLSERQLERTFMQQVGVPPKTFAIILRLRCALKAAKNGSSLADAAHAAGYADQAHFSRDARRLMGVAPSEVMSHVGDVQDIVAGAI